MVQSKCEICGKIRYLIDFPNYSKKQFLELRFCSKQCRWKDDTYREIMKKAVAKSNANPSIKKIESARKMGEANKGKHNSAETEFKSGEQNANWKGGTKKYRGSDWKVQREKALIRDKYICQRCSSEGNEVHHIAPYSETQNNNIENLITLCKRCHIITEKGYSRLIIDGEDILITNVPDKTEEQFIQLANDEFGGNLGMTLTFLMKGVVGAESAMMMEGMNNLDERVSYLEASFKAGPEEPVKSIKLASGKEIKKRK